MDLGHDLFCGASEVVFGIAAAHFWSRTVRFFVFCVKSASSTQTGGFHFATSNCLATDVDLLAVSSFQCLPVQTVRTLSNAYWICLQLSKMHCVICHCHHLTPGKPIGSATFEKEVVDHKLTCDWRLALQLKWTPQRLHCLLWPMPKWKNTHFHLHHP